jgi:hypothetical protein
MTKSRQRPKQKILPHQNNTENVELLHGYCKDISGWPSSWEIGKADLKIGEKILEEFKAFLIDRIEKGRSQKTIKTDAQYLWALGAALIDQINEDDNERKLSARALILKHVDDSGGPYWRHAYNESDHAKYDSVCRQFFKFMTTKQD